MENKFDENGLLKKEFWEPGEWHQEPDTFEMTYKDYKCMGLRNHNGVWCGYVFIPIQDPFYKNHVVDKSYMDIPLEAHGDITYGNEFNDGTYKVGFDCGHYGDYYPNRKATFEAFGEMYPDYKKGMEEIDKKYPVLAEGWPKTGTYRNLAFVKKELRSMVNQIIKKNKI